MGSFDHTTSKYYVKFDGRTIETTVNSKAAIDNKWASEVFLKYAGIEASVANGHVNEIHSNYAGKDDHVSDTEWASDMVSMYAGDEIVVGLDFEYANNKLATFQFCIGDMCLVLQLLYLDEIPQTFKTFLAYPKFVFVGIEVYENIHKLKHEYGLLCTRCADIRDIVEDKSADIHGAGTAPRLSNLVSGPCCNVAKIIRPGWFSRPKVKNIAYELICDLRMTKLDEHVSQSTWEAMVLNEGQVEYACINAYASYKSGARLISST